jgi:hypothetical protein
MHVKLRTLLASMAATAVTAVSALSADTFLRISELRIDEPGTDVNEYFELQGTPGMSLDDIWYLVIGDHSNFGTGAADLPNYRSGVVEFAVDLTGLTIPDSGYFLVATTTINLVPTTAVDYLLTQGALIFENSDNVTHVLVRGYTGIEVLDPADQLGTKAVNLDPNNDGTLVDPLPWAETIDAIGLVKLPNSVVDPLTSQEEFTYGAALGFVDIGPDGSFVPSHVFRGANDGEWNVGTFAVAGGKDTPGAANALSPVEPIIARLSPLTVAQGAEVTYTGRNFGTVSSVKIGDREVPFEILSNTSLKLTIPANAVSGQLEIINADATLLTPDTIRVLSSGQSVLAYEDFGNGFPNMVSVSLASARNWSWGILSGGNGFAEMNGFGTSPVIGPSDDWLIYEGIDLSDTENPVLEFVTGRNFGGPDISVLIATDFNGFNPSTATWTALEGYTLSETGFVVTPSGAVSLDAYKGQTVAVAFRYLTEGSASGQAATYRIHEFIVYDNTASGIGWVDTDGVGPLYNFGNGWIYSDFFGYLYLPLGLEAQNDWVWLQHFGWVFATETSLDDGMWLFSEFFGWMYTQSQLDGALLYVDGGLDYFKIGPQ